MYNSIQHFIELGTGDLEKVLINYSTDLTKIAEMVYGVTDSVVNLGLSIIAEELFCIISMQDAFFIESPQMVYRSTNILQ